MSTDILISFDTTGSMLPAIAEVRRRGQEAVKKLFYNIPDLRIGVISHGDYCDYDKAVSSLHFTNDQEALMKFFRTSPDTSGGDSDEFYEYILKLAQDFDWQADNRIFILIGDAEPHEVGYRYDNKTYYLDWKQEAIFLAKLGVSIYPVQALGRYSSNYFYEGLEKFSNGRKVNLNQLPEIVETIIAISYHKVGKLEEYKEELLKNFRMNRNLTEVFETLGSDVSTKEFEEYTKKDSSGLISVPPARFQILVVDRTTDIKTFVETNKLPFKRGRGFYQFTKSEEIQEYKEVILRNKKTGDMFTGNSARDYIGLPMGRRGTIRPHYFEEYEVYVQSTSNNRKLIGGTKFLYENEYYS